MPLLGPGSPFPRLELLDGAGAAASVPTGEKLYVFFKTTCPTCELAWPFVERLRRRADGGSYAVLGVSQDSPAKTAAFTVKFGSAVNTLYDPPPWKASDTLGLENVPTFFLVDADGRIREAFVGFQKAKLEELAGRAASRGKPGVVETAPFFSPDERVPEMRPG